MTETSLINIINLKSRADLVGKVFRESYFRLVLVVYGSILVGVCGREIVLKRRNFLFLDPEHKLQVMECNGQASIIEFDSLFFHGFSMMAPANSVQDLFYGFKSDKPIKLKKRTFSKVMQGMEDIKAEVDNGKDLTLLQSELNLILIYVTRHHQYYKRSREDAHGIRLISQLRQLINSNYLTQQKTKWYASELGIPVRRLNELANRYTEKRVHRLILERRILQSEWSLLNQPGKLVKEIAYELGFEQPGHFTTYFKRIKGITPYAFRKMYAKL